MGTLTFESSRQPFKAVRIEVPLAATDFLVDNITVTTIPQLNIALTASNTAMVWWPAPTPGFALQENAELGTTNWVGATNSVQVAGTNNQVILAAPSGNTFFRLYHR